MPVSEYGGKHLCTITEFKRRFPKATSSHWTAFTKLHWYCTQPPSAGKAPPGVMKDLPADRRVIREEAKGTLKNWYRQTNVIDHTSLRTPTILLIYPLSSTRRLGTPQLTRMPHPELTINLPRSLHPRPPSSPFLQTRNRSFQTQLPSVDTVTARSEPQTTPFAQDVTDNGHALHVPLPTALTQAAGGAPPAPPTPRPLPGPF